MNQYGLKKSAPIRVIRGPSPDAKRVISRAEELGAISDEAGRLTRTFHSPAMQRANARVGAWMRAAGMEVREDAAFNLIGRWPCANPRAKVLLLGSHLDTVRDAGKYDGPLGVLAAIEVVERLRGEKMALPFHVEVIGFSDEEGVRYQTTYLGSRALAGTLTKRDLAMIEEKGIERAKRKRGDLLARRFRVLQVGVTPPLVKNCLHAKDMRKFFSSLAAVLVFGVGCRGAI